MIDLFSAIASLFEDLLLLPHQFLSKLELSNWWLANWVNFFFLFIGSISMVYWVNQLKIFNERGEENKDPSAHSFL